jgi:hypothetical protein
MISTEGIFEYEEQNKKRIYFVFNQNNVVDL